MRYKVIIEGKEYPFPKIVYEFNKEVLDKYLFEDSGETYIDFDVLVEEGSYDELNLVSYQCSNTIGMLGLDIPEIQQKYNELGFQIRFLDDMAKKHHKNGDDYKAKQKLLEGMELELGFYKEALEQEQENQKKSSR